MSFIIIGFRNPTKRLMLVRINTPHLIVFTLTFGSYALYHAARKTLSGVKSSISADWVGNGTSTGRSLHEPLFPDEPTAQTFLGFLDALFMICYAVALIFWGWLGDRLNPLHVVVFGMIGSAISLTAFGSLPYWLNFYSIPWYIFTWAVFGIVQACGWPNEVTIMANWFPQNNRGFIMGLWAACQPVGNILGALIISFFLLMGYQATFVFNSVFILAGAIVLYIFISPKPKRHHYHLLEETRSRQRSQPTIIDTTNTSTDTSASSIESIRHSDYDREQQQISRNSTTRMSNPSSRPISICEAIFLPNVLPYCLCNACLKFVNYAFFFWLPFYLTYKYKWDESEANQLAIWYDIGGIFGSIFGGFASDRLKHRSPILYCLLLCSLPLLLVYANLGANKILHAVGMFCLGVTISGPYNLIVGTISVDLGSQPALAGNDKAMCTVTGLIDGTGSGGSALGQLFVPIIQNNLGWDWVFYLFIVMNVLAAICLLRRFCGDIHLIWITRNTTTTDENRFENEPLLNNN